MDNNADHRIPHFSSVLQKDTFKIEAADVGQIQKIRIGHNNEKMNSAWYLEKVKAIFEEKMMKPSIIFSQVLIQRHVSEESYRPKKGKRGRVVELDDRIHFESIRF